MARSFTGLDKRPSLAFDKGTTSAIEEPADLLTWPRFPPTPLAAHLDPAPRGRLLHRSDRQNALDWVKRLVQRGQQEPLPLPPSPSPWQRALEWGLASPTRAVAAATLSSGRTAVPIGKTGPDR